MDLLGDILDSMDKNVRPGLSKADKMLKKQHEEMKKTAEKERAIINNYKVKIQNKVADFLKNDKVSTMEFPPMAEKVWRTCIIEAVEESGSGLICHTYGKEDRYVIVYKNPPSELEVEARRFHDYRQWNREIEAEFKKKKEHEALVEAALSTSKDTAESSKALKKPKLIHVECEAISTNPNRNFGMVSSELKTDKRTVEETLNDIQQKKRQKTQQSSIIINPN